MAIIQNLVAMFKCDSTAFEKGTKRARNSMYGMQRETLKTQKAMLGMARSVLMLAGVGGFGYLTKKMIENASAAEEIHAKFETVFKDLRHEAAQWAEEFGDSVGRSTQDVEEWMAGLQDTFVPLGIAREEAYKLGKSLTSLAVDVASFNNKADADVIRDFTSALVGNHETVRKYGIIISENAIKQAAYNQGMAKSYEELTDLEKVQLRYSLIMSGTADAQGDALRTSESYANQVKRLKANVHEMSVELGGPFMESMNKIVTSLNNNKDTWQWFITTLGNGLAEIASGFRETRQAINEFEPVYDNFIKEQNKGKVRVSPGAFGGFGAGTMGAPPTNTDKVKTVLPEGELPEGGYLTLDLEEMDKIYYKSLENRTEILKTAADEETVINKAKAEEEMKLMHDRTEAMARMYNQMGKMSERSYEAGKALLDQQKADYLDDKIEQVAVDQWYNEQREKLDIQYYKEAGQMADGFKAAGMQIRREIATWSERAYEFSMSMRDSLSSGLESMARDIDNWGEHFKSVLEEIYWSAMRIAFIQPAANVLGNIFSSGLGSLFGGGGTTPGGMVSDGSGGQVYPAHAAGGKVGHASAYRTVNPSVFAGAPRFGSGGIVGLQPGEVPIIAHEGETIIPAGAGGGNITVNMYNNGTGLEVTDTQQYMLGDQRIIDISIRAAETNGPYRRAHSRLR